MAWRNTAESRPAQYIGFQTFYTSITGWAQPLIYAGIVQASNNHRLAFASMLVWSVLGLVLIRFTEWPTPVELAAKKATPALEA